MDLRTKKGRSVSEKKIALQATFHNRDNEFEVIFEREGEGPKVLKISSKNNVTPCRQYADSLRIGIISDCGWTTKGGQWVLGPGMVQRSLNRKNRKELGLSKGEDQASVGNFQFRRAGALKVAYPRPTACRRSRQSACAR